MKGLITETQAMPNYLVTVRAQVAARRVYQSAPEIPVAAGWEIDSIDPAKAGSDLREMVFEQDVRLQGDDMSPADALDQAPARATEIAAEGWEIVRQDKVGDLVMRLDDEPAAPSP